MRFNDEQLRQLENARQFYETWKEIVGQLGKFPGGMYWKVTNSREYLYKFLTDSGIKQVSSLGAKTADAQARYEEFTRTKAELEERRKAIEATMNERAPLLRALRLPAIDATAGKILRGFDAVNAIGTDLLVIGTYALKAYEVEAQTSFAAGMDATDDLDFTLFASAQKADPDLPRRLFIALKQADPGFTVSFGSPKTAVNRAGYQVDLLMNNAVAPSMSGALPWKPEALDGQEWLVLGNPVHAVLVDFQGWPVPVSAPDPRYFALHKLWLSKRKGRKPGKATKDKRQGVAVLKAIREHMPHYPLDETFIAQLSEELKAQLPDSEPRPG
jgi:hypothetical protein